MGTTVTWTGSTSGVWSASQNWSMFAVPTAADDVVVPTGDTVTVDSAASADNVMLGTGAPSNANLDVTASLALGGTLTGGAVVLAGTLTGGTLDTIFQGQGGTLDGVVLQGAATGTITGALAIDTLTAQSLASPVAVHGTLTLLPGLYDGLTFTLDSTWLAGGGNIMLAGGAGAVTLGATTTLALGDAAARSGLPLSVGNLVLAGLLVNQGRIGGAVPGLTIDGAGFTNDGTVALTPLTVSESIGLSPSVSGPRSWSQSFGPTADLAVAGFDNIGLIALTGGTLAVTGGSVVNAGTIALTEGTTQTLIQPGSTTAIGTVALATAVTLGSAGGGVDNTHGTVTADQIDIAGTVSLAALGALNGALRIDGVLDLGGGTFDASAYPSVTIAGEVENGTLLAGTGTLTLAGATLDHVALNGATIAPGSTLVLAGVPAGATGVMLGAVTTELALLAGESLVGIGITAGGTGLTDTLTVAAGTATFAPSTSLTLTGGTLLEGGAGTLENDGLVTVAAGRMALGSALDGAGTITVASGATLSAAQLGGSLDIVVGSGATLDVGTLAGNAVVTVEATARVTIEALTGTPTIVYAAAPALVALPGTGALPVTLQNLGSGDFVDFMGVSSSVPSTGLFVQPGAAAASGSLNVTGASGDTANLPFSTALPYVSFGVTPDATGGTLVTAAACYRAGTRIATARGEVPIEHLRRGDLIRTLSGRFVRAVWLGRRRIDCRRLARPEEAWPVRVAAHAFAPGRPARDLYLSPDHAVFVDGALVPVRYLVNGATIAQRPVARVEYWHVELPAHDVLLAEGLPAESYLDTGNRAAFAGTRHRRPLPAAAALRLWRRRACAPLLASGPRLAALHARLLARAGSLGHALTEAPAVRVIAGGREARPINEGRFRLPAGTRAVRVLTRSFVPAHLAGPGGDARRLGVAVGQVHLDGEAVALDDARLGPGWHAPESGWRWTSGEAVIATGGAREIALRVAIAGRYWQAG